MASVPTAGQLTISSRMKLSIMIAMAVGIVTFAVGLFMSHERIWQAFLLNLFYFTSLAVGGLFFAAVQYATKAGWSASIRRVSESLASFIPYAFIGAMAVIFFGKFMFEWLDPNIVAQDELLLKKEAYLNFGFFTVRTVLFFAIWYVFGRLIIGNSIKQDTKPDNIFTFKNVKLSIVFLIAFALSYSLFSVDFVMSLNPHWFSTIFGVYCFSGLFQSTLALLAILVVWLMKGPLKGYVNENHLHDIGKFLFAFTIFYAYIGFSQFMLVWYANLPEETIFFLHRANGAWLVISYSLLVFKFVVPFFMLSPRQAKRDACSLTRVSWLILVMQMVDSYWLIYPNFNDGQAVFGIWEVGLIIGFSGLFMFAVTRFLAKNKVVAVNDPYMHEALHHHV